MKFINENGVWIHKDSLPSGKRGNYLDALSMIIFSSQEMAGDLAKIEYSESRESSSRLKSQITQIRVQLDLLENNL